LTVGCSNLSLCDQQKALGMNDDETNTHEDAKQQGEKKMTMYWPQNHLKETCSLKERQYSGKPGEKLACQYWNFPVKSWHVNTDILWRHQVGMSILIFYDVINPVKSWHVNTDISRWKVGMSILIFPGEKLACQYWYFMTSSVGMSILIFYHVIKMLWLKTPEHRFAVCVMHLELEFVLKTWGIVLPKCASVISRYWNFLSKHSTWKTLKVWNFIWIK